jgi:hypothetical protein
MTNATKRKTVGWGVVGGIVCFFVLSMFMGSSGQMLLATALFAHLPVFMVPFWFIYRQFGLTSHNVTRAILFGWPAFILSAIVWEGCYHALYRRFSWPTPDLPGEFLGGLCFGWFPASLVTGVAVVSRLVVDRVLPDSPDRRI